MMTTGHSPRDAVRPLVKEDQGYSSESWDHGDLGFAFSHLEAGQHPLPSQSLELVWVSIFQPRALWVN